MRSWRDMHGPIVADLLGRPSLDLAIFLRSPTCLQILTLRGTAIVAEKSGSVRTCVDRAYVVSRFDHLTQLDQTSPLIMTTQVAENIAINCARIQPLDISVVNRIAAGEVWLYDLSLFKDD